MPAGDNPVSGVEVSVDGTRLPQELMAQMLEVKVRDDLFKPATAVLRLRDPGGVLIDDERLMVGRKFAVKTSKAADTDLRPLFEGEIVALEPEFTERDCIVAVRAYDRSHRLHGKRISRSFQNMTASDIVRKVGQEAGLPAGTVTATTVVHEYFQQSMETNWEFCWRLAAMYNVEFFVEGGRFHFRPRTPAAAGAQVAWGETLLAFRPRMSGVGQPKQVTVGNLDPKNKQVVNGRAATPSLPVKSPVADKRMEVVGSFGGDSVVVADRVVETNAEANKVAQRTLDRIASTFVEAEGKAVGDPQIRAGSTLKIDKVGKRFSGDYVLTQTTHVVRGGDPYVTSFVISGRNSHTFADLLRPPAAPEWANQLVIGLVTNNKDPEGMGRVRVKYPALSESLEGAWARVVSINAGAHRGVFMLPQIDDEVVVAFEHGDTRRPIVIGSVYGGKAKLPAYFRDEVNNPPKAAFGLRSDNKAHLESFQEMKVISDERLTVVARKSRARNSTGGMTFTADGDVEVQAQSSVTIKGTGSVTVETSGALKLKGSTVDIQSSGPVNVKGAVINLG